MRGANVASVPDSPPPHTVYFLRRAHFHEAGDAIPLPAEWSAEYTEELRAAGYIAFAPPQPPHEPWRSQSPRAVMYGPPGEPDTCGGCGAVVKFNADTGRFPPCEACQQADYARIRALEQTRLEAAERGSERASAPAVAAIADQPNASLARRAIRTIDVAHIRACRLCTEIAGAAIALYNHKNNFEDRVPTVAAVDVKLGRSSRTMRSRKRPHARLHGFPPVTPAQAVAWRTSLL